MYFKITTRVFGQKNSPQRNHLHPANRMEQEQVYTNAGKQYQSKTAD